MHVAGHLTALGWTTFTLYMIAAVLCLRTSAHNRSSVIRIHRSTSCSQRSPGGSRAWLWLGVILAMLGLNKPIDLQTLLIGLGRWIAGKAKLSPHSPWLHALFFLGFVVFIILLFLVLLLRIRIGMGTFGRQHPLATAGCCSIFVYVIIRAISITGVDKLLGWNLQHIPSLWMLEAGGLMLIIIQGLHKPAGN